MSSNVDQKNVSDAFGKRGNNGNNREAVQAHQKYTGKHNNEEEILKSLYCSG